LADAEMLFEHITIIEAQEQLKMLSAHDWPNMKKEKRKQLHRELYQKAYPKHLRKKNFVTAEDVQRSLVR
jgi:hypothetical protein